MVAKQLPGTLAIDVGGTGLKASVLGPTGLMVSDRVRTPTPYPLSPQDLVTALGALVSPLPPYGRASVGFPGVVRDGLVLAAPHFVSRTGPGGRPDRKLVAAWARFPLAAALGESLSCPVRVGNDADVQGAAVVTGVGLELVVTLGTGVGTALFRDGQVAPHLELSQHPLHKSQTYNERLGDAARKRIGAKKWQRRVLDVIEVLDRLVTFDRLFLGGGNAARLTVTLPERVSVVSNDAGILGGIALWDNHTFPQRA